MDKDKKIYEACMFTTWNKETKQNEKSKQSINISIKKRYDKILEKNIYGIEIVVDKISNVAILNKCSNNGDGEIYHTSKFTSENKSHGVREESKQDISVLIKRIFWAKSKKKIYPIEIIIDGVMNFAFLNKCPSDEQKKRLCEIYDEIEKESGFDDDIK